MAAAPDPSSVGKPSEHLFRQYVAARDRGDLGEAHRCWGELITLEFDRLKSFVALWGAGHKLSATEKEDAVSAASVRAWDKLPHVFKGRHFGEFVNALKTVVHYACTDVQRAAAKHGKHSAFIDDTDEDGYGSWDDELAETLHDQWLQGEARGDAADFVEWALPQIENDRFRLVLQRDRDGVPAAEIADELGVTMTNLYQLRRRGLKALKALKEQWDA